MNDRLFLNQSGLLEAIATYKNACNSYSSLLEQFKAVNNFIVANWKDQVGEKWGEVSKTVLNDLAKVKSNLDANVSLYNEMSQKAAETQAKAYGEVGSIM